MTVSVGSFRVGQLKAQRATTISADATAATSADSVASPDPYVQQFREADPTDRFLTPASPEWDSVSQVGHPATPIDQMVSIFGSAGFSRNPQQSLVYENTTTQDVALLYGPDSSSLPEGIRVVTPGQSATLPADASFALAQNPKTGTPATPQWVAVAGPGYPPNTNALDQTQARLVAAAISQFAQIRNAFLNILKPFFGGGQQAVRSIPTRDLYDKLRQKTKDASSGGIAIDQYVTSGGQKQMIVYLGGTTFDPANQYISNNLPKYNGRPDDSQLQKITQALKGDTSVKIMLVGFSQGGMDAQNIAAAANFKNQITTIVTFAAPIVQKPGNYNYVHIWDEGDLIPHLTFPLHQSQYNSAAAHVYESASQNDTALLYNINIPSFVPFAQAARAAIYFGQKLALHGDYSTYEQVADAFDAASGFDSVKADIAAYWNHTHVS